MIKILSPLSRVDEVEPLIMAGADEFYCGLINSGESLNDRPNDDLHNFSDADQLARAVKKIQTAGKKIYLAINKPSLDIEKALIMAKTAEQIGVNGLILSNLLLIKRLKDMNLNLELNGSCLCAVFNSGSIRFFQELGIQTFHLPRHLGLDDLRMMAIEHPEVRLSVFAMRGMCMNVEAFCRLHHLKQDPFIPCKNFKTFRVFGKGITEEDLNKKINMPRFACALCALKQLNEMGIYSVKIEGRNADLESKSTYISVIRRALNHVQSSGEDYPGLCQKLFTEYFHETCRTEYCYY